jgi:integrase/recombinase XerD
MSAPNDLAVLIERWFTDRLMWHRGVSSNTIASYRDTFRLLFAFAQTRLGKSPSQLTLRDFDAPFIGVLPAVWISSNFIGLNFPANLASARRYS